MTSAPEAPCWHTQRKGASGMRARWKTLLQLFFLQAFFFPPKKLCSAWRMHKKVRSHGPKRCIRERANIGGSQQKVKAGAGFACWRRRGRRAQSPGCRGFRSKRNAFQLCMKQGIVGNKRFPGKEVSSHLSVPPLASGIKE